MDLHAAIKAFAGLSIAVIGDVMLDRYTFGEVERVSPEAAVPIVLQTGDRCTLGGAANVANNIASLGGKPRLAGTIGDDDAGRKLLNLLQNHGINADSVLVVPGRITTEKQRIVSGENHQLLRLDRETKECLPEKYQNQCLQIARACIRSCQAVIFSDYAKGYFSQSVARDLIAFARSEKKLMLADFNPRHQSFYHGVNVITPNLKEAREMTGLQDLPQMGEKIVRDMGAHAVITRGGDGMSLFQHPDAAPYHASGKKIRVFDVSGAGDTSIAVLALGLVSGLELKDAVTLSNEAGTLVVQKPGTATLVPEELLSVLNHTAQHPVIARSWGTEQWLESNDNYCCKILTLFHGHQSNLHYHKKKEEMLIVTAGLVRLELGHETLQLRPGAFVRVPANTPHRFAGLEDSSILEIGTGNHADDHFIVSSS